MKYPALLLVLACCFTGLALTAQERSRGPDGGTHTRVSGVEVLAIPGKPFSANTSTDWTRTLEDGSTMTLYLDAILARDGEGRVYRERHTFIRMGHHLLFTERGHPSAAFGSPRRRRKKYV